MFVERSREAVHVGEERGSLCEYSLHMRITLKLVGTLSRDDRAADPQAGVQGDVCSSRRHIAQCVGDAEEGGEASLGGST